MTPSSRLATAFTALVVVAGCAEGDDAVGPAGQDMTDSPYAAWANGPSPDPSSFPLAVWLQSPENAAAYRELGINLYIGLWEGPTEAQLAVLSAAGMRVICDQSAVGLAHRDDPIIAGWMHGDEPDNAQAIPGREGWGPAVDPAVLQADAARMRAADPTRPVWLNLGQGVANEDWVGRGGPRQDYPRYVAATDIISFDVYPVAGIRRSDGERYLWYVAKGVDSLRHWAADGQPVWNVIETTRISADRGPTPAQVRAEVWMSIVHGSMGIVYFCHEWNPVFREARLLEDGQMRAAVGAINAQILRLAPVLNAATVAGRVAGVGDTPGVPVDVLAKAHGGDLWVFAAAMRMGATAAAFTVAGVEAATVQVVDEGRSLALAAGTFRDAFAADHEVHIYRIPGAGR